MPLGLENVRRAGSKAAAPKVSETVTAYVAKVTTDPSFKKLNLNLGAKSQIDARVMRQILSIPVVKADVAKFAKEVLLESPYVFDLGREAKMAVLAEMGKQGAPKEQAQQFAEQFAGMDNSMILQSAYDAAAGGERIPTYYEHLEATMRFFDGFSSDGPKLGASTLIAKHPHLQKLQQAGWNVAKLLSERPEIAARLSRPEFKPESGVEMAAAHFDIPDATLTKTAQEAALLGYGSVFVAPNSAPIMEKVLRGTGIAVHSEE